MNKIKKNDDVIVISGKDKGTIGVVLDVLSDDKLIVSGVAIKTKHVKPNPNKNIVGGLIKENGKIHISNVAILNPSTKKADKIAIKVENGVKIRVFKSNGKAVEKV